MNETLIELVGLAATAVFIVGRLSAKIDGVTERVNRVAKEVDRIDGRVRTLESARGK